MPHAAECPACGTSMRLPDGSAGKNVKCKACEAILAIGHDREGGLVLTQRQPPRPVPEPETQCPGCGEHVSPDDKFCGSCGVEVAEAKEVETRKANSRALSARRREFRATRRRHRKMLTASRWLLVLAAVFLVIGTIGGLSASADARAANRELEPFSDSRELQVEGEWMTVAELRVAIDREVLLTYGINYLLASIMAGLYFWARKSPFPAMLTGLCVYLVLIVLNAIAEPISLVQGWIWKVMIISALVGGMQAALAERTKVARSARVPSRRR